MEMDGSRQKKRDGEQKNWSMERTLDRERERAQQRRSERQRPRPETEYTTEGIA
jgi:hypothetical protein